MLAADQLLRATLLPPPTPQTSRALILVRKSSADGAKREEGAGLSPLTAPELVKPLPRAFASAKEEVRGALAQAQAAVERARQREAELAQARDRQALLEQEVGTLKEEAGRLRGELEASDPNRERALLHEAVRDLSRQIGEVKNMVRGTRDELLTQVGSLKRRSGEGQQPDGGSARARDFGGSQPATGLRGRPTALMIVAAVALLVTVGALLFLYWPTPAAPDPVREIRTGPLAPEG
jgi:Sec-independent protein translocase protein TatA